MCTTFDLKFRELMRRVVGVHGSACSISGMRYTHIEDAVKKERERKRRERERGGEGENEWVLKRDGDPVPADSAADLFVPFPRRNERRTNEIPRSIIDTEPGVGTGRARVLRLRMCGHEIGMLTFDFALNTYSGHVDVGLIKSRAP